MLFLRLNQLGLGRLKYPRSCVRFATTQFGKFHDNLQLKRKNAEYHVYAKLRNGQPCWSFEINHLVQMIEKDLIAEESNVNSLMRACKMDIVDLFPREQKLLTEQAWNLANGSRLTTPRTTRMYNNMLEAYNFQEMDIQEEVVKEDMNKNRVKIGEYTHINFLENHCRKGDIEKALKNLEDRAKIGKPIVEDVARHIIQCHASLGEWEAAENVLKMMKRRKIYWGKKTLNAFILGFASSGDIGRLEKYMNKMQDRGEKVVLRDDNVILRDDKVMLLALQYLCRNFSDKAGFLLDKLPIDQKLFNTESRRTVKALIEMGHSDVAFALVEKTTMMKENNTELDRVIKALPSVIVFDDLVKRLDNIEEIFAKVTALKKIDDKIVGRAVIRLVNLVLENSVTIEKAIEINNLLHDRFPGEVNVSQIYAKQNAKKRMQYAESAEEVLQVFTIFSQFGLRLDNSITWDYAMMKLLPDIPEGDEFYTVENVVDRCFEIHRTILKISDQYNKVYTISLVWCHIMQYMLNRDFFWTHLTIFFKAAAEISRINGVAYGPNKWKISLAKALLYTKDVEAYIDIIEITYKNIEKKGELSDFVNVTQSLFDVIKIGEAEDVTWRGLVYKVLHELWARQIMLPASVAEGLAEQLKKHDQSLAILVANIKVIDDNGDVVNDFKLNRVHRYNKKIRRRLKKGLMDMEE